MHEHPPRHRIGSRSFVHRPAHDLSGSEHDPGYLEQHEVKVLLLEKRRVLAAELLRAAARLALGRAPSAAEVRELRLEHRKCAFGRFGLGLNGGNHGTVNWEMRKGAGAHLP